MPHATLAAPLAALLLDVSLKSLALFAVAGLACLALRRAAAAARHALWLLVLGGLLCLPVFCVLLPHWLAPVLPAPSPSRVIAVQLPAVASATPTAPVVFSPPPPLPTVPTATEKAVATHEADAPLATVMAAVPASRPISTKPTVTGWLCLAWLLGTLLVLGRILLGWATAFRLVRRCCSVTEGPLVEAANAAHRSLGLTRSLSVHLGDVAVPMTCGVRRPIVLLPSDASDWPADRLRAVLLHEAAHVKRLDWATLLFAQSVCALYWFHPLVWLSAARLRAESEGSCDDLVLACGVPATDYAAHLLEIVLGLASRRQALTGTVAMAHRQEVSSRLRTILDGHNPRRGVPRRGLALATVAAVALLAPLAALRPVNSDDAKAAKMGDARPVQTISWEKTTHQYDASGRLSATQPSHSLLWLRSDPPGLGIVDVSDQGEVVYQDKHTAGAAKTAQMVEDNIRDFTSYPIVGASPSPPKIIGLSAWNSSPWQEKTVSLEGKQALLFTHDIHSASASPSRFRQNLAIHVSRWFDPNSHRLIRGEQDVTETAPDKGRVVDIDHDIHYNQPSPPGVFDGSLPPGATFNDLSAPVPPSVGFRRYISRPLPDGTRYTFLYPSYFTKVGPSSPDTENSFDCADLGYPETPVRWTAVRGGKIIAANLYGTGDSTWSSPHQELLEVIVGRAGDVPFLPGRRSIRRDIRRVGPNGSHHDISITDARTHFRFLLVHEDRDIPALFAQTDPVISSSFQVLPPGTNPALSTSGSAVYTVNLSHTPGAIVQRTGSGLKLRLFSNNKVFWTPVRTDTLKIMSLHVNSWRLQDAAGNAVVLNDNDLRRVIVINRTEQPVTLVSRAGTPVAPVTLPPHSLMIVNRVLFPLTVSGTTQWGPYVMSMPKTKHQLPVTIIRAPPPQRSQEGVFEKIMTDLG